MDIQIVLILMYLLLVYSTWANERPQWLKTGHHAAYPESRYIQAIGRAEKTGNAEQDWERAKQAAFQQIAQTIQLRISGKQRVIKLELGENQLYREQAAEEIVSETNIKLSGLWLQDTYYDRKQKVYYALAILDRQKAAQALQNEYMMFIDRAERGYQQTLTLFSKRQFLPALSSLRRSFGSVVAAQDRQMLVGVLTGSAFISQNDFDAERLLQALQRYLSQLIVESKVKSLTLSSTDDLPYALDLQASFGDEPVQFLSIETEFQQGSGDVDVPDPTDSTGVTKVLITRLKSAPMGEYQLQMWPDLRQYLFPNVDETTNLWNEILTNARNAIQVRIRRLDLRLDDYIYDLAARLCTSLRNHEETYKLLLGNVTFADTGVSSPFIAYLLDKFSSALATQYGIQVVDPELAIEKIHKTRNTYKMSRRPDEPEILAMLVDADATVTGSYWDRGDALELIVRVVERESGATVSSATLKLPKSLIPHGLSFLPDNFSEFAKILSIGNRTRRDSKLSVDVWTDRGDGGIYRSGDRLTIFVRSNEDCYLYLIYHDAAGNDVLIFPNERQPRHKILAGVVYQIPDARDPFEFVIQGPFGSELIKAIVSKSPLPELSGKVLSNGIKLLSGSFKDNITRVRGISMRSKGYAEASCVLTTMK